MFFLNDADFDNVYLLFWEGSFTVMLLYSQSIQNRLLIHIIFVGFSLFFQIIKSRQTCQLLLSQTCYLVDLIQLGGT